MTFLGDCGFGSLLVLISLEEVIFRQAWVNLVTCRDFSSANTVFSYDGKRLGVTSPGLGLGCCAGLWMLWTWQEESLADE